MIFGLFLLSGAGGLVYEVLWIRRLTLVFGSGLFATSTILATFMGGLALGAFWLGRKADAQRRPLEMFGWLEIGIGVYALSIPAILEAVLPIYRAVYAGHEGDWTSINATRLALSAAVFFLPTLLMGGTLPALSRYLSAERGRLGETVGKLYAVNTLGAVLGCLAAGFVLIESLGLRGAELATAGVNLVVGTTAVAVARRAPRSEERALPRDRREAAAGEPRNLVLAAYSLSGFAALGYEVVWARLLTFFLGNSTYAFATMLGTFLFGIGAGALVGARFVERIADPFRTFAWMQVGIGASMGLGLAFYPESPYLYGALAQVVPPSSWLGWLVLRFAIAAAVLLVPTLLMGATFPLAGRLYFAARGTIGSDVGSLYAGNTVGAIAGSLVVGFLVVPALGVRNSVVAMIAVNAAVAAAMALRGTPRRTAIAGMAATLAVVAAVALPSDVFLSAVKRSFPNDEIVYYREFPSATVFVTRSEDGERWMHFSDKRASGGTMNLPGHRFWGHLPALLAKERRSALVIAFGSGLTLGAVATHPFEDVACAEICEGIREPARLFPESGGVLDDPRVRLIFDDGRNVVLGTGKTFDVIVAEPPLLETAGVVNLYTEEFYRLVKDRLSPGGVFCQWVPSFEFRREEHALILRTFLEVFPDATFWGSPLYGDTVLVGGHGPVPLDVAEMSRRFAEPRVRKDLEESGIADLAELLGYFAMSPGRLREWCGEGPILTDDRTVLDFRMPRLRAGATPWRKTTFWRRSFVVPPDVLAMQRGESVAPHLRMPEEGREAFLERLRAVEGAKDLVLEGHIAGVTGEAEAQARAYARAAEAFPGVTNARYYAALHRIERAEERAAAGDREGARLLAESAVLLSRGFPHLESRLRTLRVPLRGT